MFTRGYRYTHMGVSDGVYFPNGIFLGKMMISHGISINIYIY